jgi:hypothetical protein
VKSVTVVAAELGVDTLEGRVTVGLGLLDTAQEIIISGWSGYYCEAKYEVW